MNRYKVDESPLKNLNANSASGLTAFNGMRINSSSTQKPPMAPTSVNRFAMNVLNSAATVINEQPDCGMVQPYGSRWTSANREPDTKPKETIFK